MPPVCLRRVAHGGAVGDRGAVQGDAGDQEDEDHGVDVEGEQASPPGQAYGGDAGGQQEP